MKSDLMSESTKAESHRLQGSVEGRRKYVRPRTNSPFPPLQNRTMAKPNRLVKQSESFNQDIVDLCENTKLSPDISLPPNYKIINCDGSDWGYFLKQKQQ